MYKINDRKNFESDFDLFKYDTFKSILSALDVVKKSGEVTESIISAILALYEEPNCKTLGDVWEKALNFTFYSNSLMTLTVQMLAEIYRCNLTDEDCYIACLDANINNIDHAIELFNDVIKDAKGVYNYILNIHEDIRAAYDSKRSHKIWKANGSIRTLIDMIQLLIRTHLSPAKTFLLCQKELYNEK